MELATLRKWRAFVPAVLLGLVLAPILYDVIGRIPDAVREEGLFGDAIKFGLLLVFLPLGYLYDLVQARRIINSASHGRINRFIEDQLRLSLQPSVGTAALDRAPVGDKRWMRLLYRQVDEDATLKEIATRIRDNGMRWSTVADIATIFIPGGIALGLYASFAERPLLAYWALLITALGFLGVLLLPVVERRHVSLCSEQQQHIRAFRSDQLVADFHKVFGQ